MNKIDLDAIISSVWAGLDKGPENNLNIKRVMKESIHQALVLAYENAHAYLDHDCETEQGDPSVIIDRDSIMDVEKLIV